MTDTTTAALTIPGASASPQGALPNVQAVRTTICDKTAAVCAQAYGSRLRALVLTGSLARNEATVVLQKDECKVLGDADFLLVFGQHAVEPKAAELNDLASEIEACLAPHGLSVAIGLASVRPGYFRSLPPHSYSYELRVCGSVVWGDAKILELIPRYSAAQLSREDAWRTLCHRMIELLGSMVDDNSSSPALPESARYPAQKLCLDTATSYLVFAGGYEPTYAARSRRLSELARLANDDSGQPFPLTEFAKLISQCTTWKLQPGSCDDLQLRDLLDQVVWYACRLWRWEAAQLGGVDGHSDLGTLINAVAAQQSLPARVRGWISLLRRVERITPHDCICWTKLIRRATPRYLIYWVAAELFFAPGGKLGKGEQLPGPEVAWAELRQLLPAVPGPNSNPSWQDLAVDVWWNYQRFLMGTHL